MFELTAGAALVATGVAKVVSIAGDEPYLEMQDTLLGMPIIWVMAGAAVLECAAAFGLSLMAGNSIVYAGVCALGAAFLVYRVRLAFVGQDGGCPCLGRAGDWLGLSKEAVDILLWLLALWLFIGGGVCTVASVSRDGRDARSELRGR